MWFTKNVFETMLHYGVILVNILFLCKYPKFRKTVLDVYGKGKDEGMMSEVVKNRKSILKFLKIWLKYVLVYTFKNSFYFESTRFCKSEHAFSSPDVEKIYIKKHLPLPLSLLSLSKGM